MAHVAQCSHQSSGTINARIETVSLRIWFQNTITWTKKRRIRNRSRRSATAATKKAKASAVSHYSLLGMHVAVEQADHEPASQRAIIHETPCSSPTRPTLQSPCFCQRDQQASEQLSMKLRAVPQHVPHYNHLASVSETGTCFFNGSIGSKFPLGRASAPLSTGRFFIGRLGSN